MDAMYHVTNNATVQVYTISIQRVVKSKKDSSYTFPWKGVAHIAHSLQKISATKTWRNIGYRFQKK